MMLYEKYRPKSWDEILGQEQAVNVMHRLRKTGLGGHALWVSGPSGVGKSSLARLAAMEIADPFNIEEYDAGRLTDKWVEEIERSLHSYRIGEKTGVAVIVNEAHAMKAPVVRQLLVTLERIPHHALWVFTTSLKGQLSLFDKSDDASPLLSRCICLTLKATGLDLAFAIRAREIAQENCLDGAPLEDYIGLAKSCRANFREMLCQIEAGGMLSH